MNLFPIHLESAVNSRVHRWQVSSKDLTSLHFSSWWKHVDIFVKVLASPKEIGYNRWKWSGPKLLTFDLYPWWHIPSLFKPSEIEGSCLFWTIIPSACLHNSECYRFCVWKRAHEYKILIVLQENIQTSGYLRLKWLFLKSLCFSSQ